MSCPLPLEVPELPEEDDPLLGMSCAAQSRVFGGAGHGMSFAQAAGVSTSEPHAGKPQTRASTGTSQQAAKVRLLTLR
jgi:hypothetical protein